MTDKEALNKIAVELLHLDTDSMTKIEYKIAQILESIGILKARIRFDQPIEYKIKTFILANNN